MAALAVVIMNLGGLIPIATFVCPMLCMVLLKVVLRMTTARIAWAWYGAVSDADFSVEALDAKLQELLGGEAKEQTFVLPYELSGDMPFISYPHDFLNAVSCGILDFYYDLYAEMDSELGGGEDG